MNHVRYVEKIIGFVMTIEMLMGMERSLIIVRAKITWGFVLI